MKTKCIFSFVAALLLQFTTVKADVYTDGIAKLLENEAIATIGTNNMIQADGINAESLKKELGPIIVEWMAPHYRQNMSEDQFKQMVDYFLKPEYSKVWKKVMVAANANPNDMQNLISPTDMQALATGGTISDLKLPDCDPKLLKEVQHALKINNMIEMLSAAISPVKEMLLNQLSGNLPEEQKGQLIGMFAKMFDFAERNMGTIITTSLVKTATLDDMKVINAIEKESFFPSYQKANVELSKDVKPLMETLMSKMMAQ